MVTTYVVALSPFTHPLSTFRFAVQWEDRGFGSSNSHIWTELRDKLSVPPLTTAPRVMSEIGRSEFAKQYEDGNYPVIIGDSTIQWPGYNTWSLKSFCDRFGGILWRFSDTHGEMLPLSTYASYIAER